MARPRTIVLDAAEAARRYEAGATLKREYARAHRDHLNEAKRRRRTKARAEGRRVT